MCCSQPVKTLLKQSLLNKKKSPNYIQLYTINIFVQSFLHTGRYKVNEQDMT